MELEELETNEKKESGKVENVTPKIIETGMILLIDQVACSCNFCEIINKGLTDLVVPDFFLSIH